MNALVKELPQIIGLLLFVVGLLVITAICIAIGQWFMGAIGRMGLDSAQAQWTAYLTGLMLAISVSLTVMGRLLTKEWWWQ